MYAHRFERTINWYVISFSDIKVTRLRLSRSCKWRSYSSLIMMVMNSNVFDGVRWLRKCVRADSLRILLKNRAFLTLLRSSCSV